MDFLHHLTSSTYIDLFLIISIGVILGRIRFWGSSLDISAVIFIAIIFGHFGIVIPSIIQQIGLIMFIYSVGIQAGPGFFDAFSGSGKVQIVLAVFMVVFSYILSLLASLILHLDFNLSLGLLNGALSSTPGLAAAMESTRSHLVTIGFGVAYPFGILGVILFLRFSPWILRINIAKAEEDYRQGLLRKNPELLAKNFLVKNENIFNRKLRDLNLRSMSGATISRIVHKGHSIPAEESTVLQKGDLVRAVGTKEALDKLKILIGKETDQEITRSGEFGAQWVMVTNKDVVNKTLAELNLKETYHATVTRIRRSGIDITPNADSHLRFGDKLMVASTKGNMEGVANFLGNNIKKLTETDFLPIVSGILIGLVIGIIPIPLFGGITLKLGLTGGILFSAIVLSRLGKTGPLIWNISGPANQVLRGLGLLFFLSATGTQAGKSLVATVEQYGILLLAIGAVVTIAPMLAAWFIGKFWLKLNTLTLLGILAGGMTSTPGLSAIESLSESNGAPIAYATVYPFALVALILLSTLSGYLF